MAAPAVHASLRCRDIATRNLLVDDNFHVRVADFGMARLKDNSREKGATVRQAGVQSLPAVVPSMAAAAAAAVVVVVGGDNQMTLHGPVKWEAPECLLSQSTGKLFSESSDVFSFGECSSHCSDDTGGPRLRGLTRCRCCCFCVSSFSLLQL